MQIIGLTRKSGTYKGKPYDKMGVYYSYTDSDTVGVATQYVSIPYERFAEAASSMGLESLDDALGLEITPLYNRYGRAEDLRLEPAVPEVVVTT